MEQIDFDEITAAEYGKGVAELGGEEAPIVISLDDDKKEAKEEKTGTANAGRLCCKVKRNWKRKDVSKTAVKTAKVLLVSM